MRQIGAVEVRNRQFAEDVIQDRGGILDRVIALHHARRFKAGEGESLDIFVQGDAVLQADRDRDGEVVHHGAEARTFLVHVDENLAQAAIAVFAGAQVNLMPAHDGLLRIALAPFGQLFAVGADDFLDDDLFNDLLGNHCRLFLRRTGCKDFFGLFIVLDQGRGQRLAQL